MAEIWCLVTSFI